MGMMRYCTRKGGFQICNGDCYWCNRHREEEMTECPYYDPLYCDTRIGGCEGCGLKEEEEE